MNPIGIMQGRLSPPHLDRIQSFPETTWRWEFELGRQAGMDCIEWIFEAETASVNPLASDEGIQELHALMETSGVRIWSVCADYYMAKHLVTADGAPNQDNVEHLRWLLGRAAKLGVGARYIVLPFVDASSLRTPERIRGVVVAMRAVLPHAEQACVELHLETDLSPSVLRSMLEQLSTRWIRANYDIGNSASLGHDPEEELTALQPWLGSIHVKDRRLGGGTVPLGTGSANFPLCFRLIAEANFTGPFILQAARESHVTEVKLAKYNRRFVEHHLAQLATSL